MEELFFVRAENTLSFPIQNGIYIHNTDDDTFFSLEEGTGTYIWENLDGSKSVKEIILDVADITGECTYEKIKDDILGFIKELQDEGLIVIEGYER